MTDAQKIEASLSNMNREIAARFRAETHTCPECGQPMTPSKMSPAFCVWYACTNLDCDA